jgi:large subunit ribosomal protein L6
MSRVGKMPVKIPEKVKVAVAGTTIKVEGPKGKMSFAFNPVVKVEVASGEVRVTRPDDSRLAKGLHGLTRTMVKNALDGVTKGYERTLEISGVGFKAEGKGKEINFTLGFSHPVVFKLPEGVTA